MNRPPSPTELQALADGYMPATGGIDLKAAGLSQRDAILSLFDDGVTLWRTSAGGDTYVSVKVDEHVENFALGSRAWRDWTLARFAATYTVSGRPASVGESVLRDARLALEGRAYVGGIIRRAEHRVAEAFGSLYVDTGNDDWSAIEIAPDSVRQVIVPPVPIVRSRRTAPMQVAEADWSPIRQLLGHLSNNNFILTIAWAVAAIGLPRGPFPVLFTMGEAGSAKTTTNRLIQAIVDPVAGDLLQPPRDDRDLIAAARAARVLAFDNLSRISAELADSLCRLATGAEIGGRALFTDHDSATFSACRPIIINGIPDLASRGDLADRGIVIRLDPIQKRRSERDYWAEAEEALPSARMAIFEALAVALARMPETPTPNVRMADFARLVLAAEPALPWGRGEFLMAYAENRRHAIVATLEGDLVAARVVALMETRETWQSTVSEFYIMLSSEMSPDAKRNGDWPGNARWFSDRLTRASPALRAVGIMVTTKRTATGTIVSISRIAPSASFASSAAETGAGESDASDASDASRLISGRADLRREAVPT
jgi:putative DNA primase/helicase